MNNVSKETLLPWRRGGLVVSALDFRTGARWLEPSLRRRIVSLDKKLYFTSSLGTGSHNAEG